MKIPLLCTNTDISILNDYYIIFYDIVILIVCIFIMYNYFYKMMDKNKKYMFLKSMCKSLLLYIMLLLILFKIYVYLNVINYIICDKTTKLCQDLYSIIYIFSYWVSNKIITDMLITYFSEKEKENIILWQVLCLFEWKWL